MNNKIISTNQAITICKILRTQGKRIVLVGGCFDVLHIGHIAFLKEARQRGDVLIVLLESDENINHLKGPNRPINTQKDRAEILENLEIVDYVVNLPAFTKNVDYDNLVISLKPAIIAITKGDPGKNHKDRQAEKIGAKVVEVTDTVSNRSTTKLLEILTEL
jgi:rfaE bifunctional protein nucleotidyltransferase chain/domain